MLIQDIFKKDSRNLLPQFNLFPLSDFFRKVQVYFYWRYKLSLKKMSLICTCFQTGTVAKSTISKYFEAFSEIVKIETSSDSSTVLMRSLNFFSQIIKGKFITRSYKVLFFFPKLERWEIIFFWKYQLHNNRFDWKLLFNPNKLIIE